MEYNVLNTFNKRKTISVCGCIFLFFFLEQDTFQK